MTRILVAGATGELGRLVVRNLQARGCWVRVLSRSHERAARLGANEVYLGDATREGGIADACKGVERVFSCLGQSVGTDLRNRGPGYHAVDYVGNHRLIEAAKQAGVHRFVYVSVFRAEDYPQVAYFRAHADVAAVLRQSGLSYAVIQPNGFFSAYRAFFEMAQSGQVVVFGSGKARTNPIHDSDLAKVCADATLADDNGNVPVGGPTIHTRREVAELAFAALGKPPRIVTAPSWAPHVLGSIIRPFAPRIGELMSFLGTVSRDDFVAPVHGTQSLAAYYATLSKPKSTA